MHLKERASTGGLQPAHRLDGALGTIRALVLETLRQQIASRFDLISAVISRWPTGARAGLSKSLDFLLVTIDGA